MSRKTVLLQLNVLTIYDTNQRSGSKKDGPRSSSQVPPKREVDRSPRFQIPCLQTSKPIVDEETGSSIETVKINVHGRVQGMARRLQI